MNEPINTPTPAAPPPPKSNNTLVLVIVGVVILCCCCLGALGTFLAFGDMFMQALSF
jgi:hypothetical protein